MLIKLRKTRKLHNEELNGLYSYSNNVRVIKSRRTRWTSYVVRTEGEERCKQGFGRES